MPRRDRYNRNNQNNQNNSTPPESETSMQQVMNHAANAVKSLLDFCGPTNTSSDDDSPKRRIPPGAQLIIPRPRSLQLEAAIPQKLSAEKAIAISSEAETPRMAIEKECHLELVRLEALFCTTLQKQEFFQQEMAGRSILFSQQLFLMHLPAAIALQTEEAQARADIELMFKDDKAIVESSTPSAQFFKPTTQTKTEAGSWGSLAMRILGR